MKKWMALALCALVLCGMAACSRPLAAEDLMRDVKPKTTAEPVSQSDAEQEIGEGMADFSVRLLQENAAAADNVLVSPISALYALSMTANGAAGQTLAQMEQALGAPVEELNRLLDRYWRGMSVTAKDQLAMANAIWLREDPSLSVDPDFLQTNADSYDAAIKAAPFDARTVKEINDWVSENTKGRIEEIIEKLDDSAMLCLVNALSFDAKWHKTYENVQVQNGTFTTEAGLARDVELMYSEEGRYLQSDNARGFVKYYKGGRFAFAGLLPNEGMSVDELLDSLTGQSLLALLNGGQQTTVLAAIPKFETETSLRLPESLQNMGMTDAFDMDKADFSAMGSADGPLYIGQVLQKTYLSVDEEGTKAGAATVVEAAAGDAPEPEPPPEVYLNRPFVYLVFDYRTNMPLFFGVIRDL